MSAIKNETEVVLRLSSNIIGDNETNFPHKLLLTNRQVANLRKAFANYLSGGFLGRLLGPLLKTGLPLMKNVIKPLAKSVLIHLGLTAAASAAEEGIHKKVLGSGHHHFSSSALPHHPLSSALHNNNTIPIIWNNEMKDIIRIVKSLEVSSLLPGGTSETIQWS